MNPVSLLQRVLPVILLLAFGPITSAQDRSATSHSPAISSLNTTSPFPPPEANDYTFVIDAGAGLDTGCSYRSDGPLRIRLPIGRVLGNLTKLKAGGLVPATVRLEFPAFDVDTAGAQGRPPERDRVTFIGKDGVPHVVPGEFTTGLNDTWIMQRFDIPIEWLNLPDDPLEGGTVSPADNEIRIDIDTASVDEENWCTAVDWVTVTIDNPIPPRPWIGAHGMFSDSHIWNTLWVPGIKALGIPAAAGPDMGRLDIYERNAEKISFEVEAARARWGVDRVNIMAHSKGGIDSRHYIENRETVENLVQMGTPNAGSPLADTIQVTSILTMGLAGNLRFNQMAGGLGGYQLTRPYMFVYNGFHGHNPKVKYMSIGGLHTPGGWFSDPRGRSLQAIVGPGDLIVPLSSAHAMHYTANRTVTSAYPPTFGPASHTELHRNLTVFGIASPLITAPGLDSMSPANWAATPPGGLTPRAANEVNLNGGLQQAKTFGGKLQQPQTSSHTFPVDSAATLSFTLLHTEGELDLKLTDPNGQVFDASTVAGRSDVSRQETEIPGGLMEVYAFTGSFAAGNWTATVTANNTSGPVDYGVVAWLEDAPLQMTAAVDRLSAAVGGEFVLSATLKNGALPVNGAAAHAAVLLPDGVTLQDVVLADDGSSPDAVSNDGVYTARFSGATQAGAYGIAIATTGTTGGVPFSREAYLSIFATASGSTILSGIRDSGRDLNSNGLFDQLVLKVPVQITAGGTYRLAATLVDSSGNVLETSDSFALTPASTEVELAFDGATLFAHGVDGPFKITSVRMAEELNDVILPLTETNSVYNTAPYSFMEFEGAGLVLTGTNSAMGVDTNANGKFDVLQVDIGVNIRTAGFYQWSARLRDRNGREITLAESSGNLPSGVSSIRLSFDGSAVGRNGINGPFHITDLLLFSTADTLSAADVFSSPPLPASDFEGFIAPAVSVQFSSANYSALESQHGVDVTVTRSGLISDAVSVNYRTADDVALERSDYTTAAGTISFAPGETVKTFHVLITDDAYVEGDENFAVVLSDPTGVAALGTHDTALVTILSDDSDPHAPNPVDDSEFFVRQHYHDFLGRQPDAAGLAYWVQKIESCGADTLCREDRRINVSASFFLSIEFQETKFFAVRIQRAAFGRKSEDPASRLTYRQLVRDTSRLGEGVIVGKPGFEQKLEQNKQAYAEQVVAGPDFLPRFPLSLTAAEYVDALYSSAGVVPTSTERQEAITAFGGGGAEGRVAALRNVANSDSLSHAEFTPAFVLAEYFGYLRRDPDTPGYTFWLSKLSGFDGNFIEAEMIKAFISSGEYRSRFNSR